MDDSYDFLKMRSLRSNPKYRYVDQCSMFILFCNLLVAATKYLTRSNMRENFYLVLWFGGTDHYGGECILSRGDLICPFFNMVQDKWLVRLDMKPNSWLQEFIPSSRALQWQFFNSPSQVPQTGDQVFKHKTLWGTFTIKS